jgi:hypothetical protein
MKILFTGMGSSHCKPPVNVSFFSALAMGYEEFAEVTWAPPSTEWTRNDLENFDLILFGYIPPTSKSANFIYGALHLLNLMYESPKLRVVVDNPQVWQYKNSISSFKRNPDQVFSDFYKTKINFSEANAARIRNSVGMLVEKLHSVVWPITLVPQLPWDSRDAIQEKVDFIPGERLVLLNPDSLLLKDPSPRKTASSKWAVENIKSSWWTKLEPTLRMPAAPLLKNRVRGTDTEASLTMSTSMAVALGPQDRKVGTWWSYRYVQALNTSTPVATMWQATLDFEPSWGVLPYQLEDADDGLRSQISLAQRKSYETSIPSKTEFLKTLQALMLDLPKERI